MTLLGETLDDAAAVMGAAGFREDTRRPDRYLARLGSLLVELDGDPVTRVSMVAPPSAAFGKVTNVVTRLIAPPRDAEVLLRWTTRTLASYAGTVDDDNPLAVHLKAGTYWMRLQSLTSGLIVVTWSLT